MYLLLKQRWRWKDSRLSQCFSLWLIPCRVFNKRINVQKWRQKVTKILTLAFFCCCPLSLELSVQWFLWLTKLLVWSPDFFIAIASYRSRLKQYQQKYRSRKDGKGTNVSFPWITLYSSVSRPWQLEDIWTNSRIPQRATLYRNGCIIFNILMLQPVNMF